MAVSTNSYFSNSLVGVPLIGGNVDIYDETPLPQFVIGQKYEREDGAVFRYAHFGAAITTGGSLVAPDLSESAYEMTDNSIIATSSTYQMPNEPADIYPGKAASRYIIITLSGITKNQFAGGLIAIVKGTGYGYSYRIKGNTATGDPASGKIRVELYDPLAVTVDATSDFIISPCLYANLEAADIGTNIGLPVGVANVPHTSGYYGWVQTKGLAAIHQKGVLAKGDLVELNADVGGAVIKFAKAATIVTSNNLSTALAMPIIGVVAGAGSDTGQSIVKFNLE